MGGQEVPRDEVVRVADEPEVRGREAVEELDHLGGRPQHALHRAFERQDRARTLGDREQPLDRVEKERPRLGERFSGESHHSSVGCRVPACVETTHVPASGAASRHRSTYAMFARRSASSGTIRFL